MLVILTCGALFGQTARADSIGGLTVLRIFSEGTGGGGFYPKEPIPMCKWGLMYVDFQSPAGRAKLALLMQAKAQGLLLQRVDYVVNLDSTCSATAIHIE
ncbi:MAG: hypothetical protein IV107_18930 [Paucibacter sp.]|nr:hypothetical protein [Roseateles sp.]